MNNQKQKVSLKESGSRVSRWFREMRSELKKVVWPDRKKLLNNCSVAIVMMVASGIVIGAFDQLALFIVRWIIGLGRLF
ncbi:MAG: preprotein translocase subunit SecE [Oscillospiraceae bacterium]|jgi:preprotein translocase subunit SecE|nr:preprotein translocase subunit SecE [Oscillospiraceae bacterium]